MKTNLKNKALTLLTLVGICTAVQSVVCMNWFPDEITQVSKQEELNNQLFEVVEKSGYETMEPLKQSVCETIQELLKNGADINSKDVVLSYTPLHQAACKGNYEMVKFLIICGADIYSTTRIDATPYDLAFMCIQHDICSLLRSSMNYNKKLLETKDKYANTSGLVIYFKFFNKTK